MIGRRHGGGGRRDRWTLVTEIHHACGIALSFFGLSFFGLSFFCWLLFTLAIYALPTFAGLSAGLAAFHSGAGVLGALVFGLVAGGATVACGQLTVAIWRTPLIRVFIGLAYGVPAAIAGYQVSFALAGIGMPSVGWQTAFAVIGAIVAGCTAFSRLALFVSPPAGQGIAGSYLPVEERLHDQGR